MVCVEACRGRVRGVCGAGRVRCGVCVGRVRGVCGVCAGRVSGVSLAALLSGYLGKSGHLPR